MATVQSEEKQEQRHPKNQEVLEEEEEEGYEESFFASRGCCFRWICFGRYRTSDTSGRSLLRNEGNNGEWWLLKKMKKVREVSEIVAGPRWKTFLRRFNRGGREKKGQFQYDPLSYALNFDGGVELQEEDAEEERLRYPNISDRFATPAGMNGLDHDRAAFRL